MALPESYSPTLADGAPVALSTVFPQMFDFSAAMRAPFDYAAPFWKLYAETAAASMSMAAQWMRPLGMAQVFAEAQKAMIQPLQPLVPATPADAVEAFGTPLEAVADTTQAVVAETQAAAAEVVELPTRIEVAGEPEPAIVGGESAPISPLATTPPDAD
jgi:hypothetical protein